jgi:alginate O-acetyltransferase complex protein AlgI
VVLLLFYCGPRAWRKVMLLVASYFFYMCWNPKFILLVLSLTAIDYTAALWIVRSTTPRTRKLALIASLGANIGLLGFFKYYNSLAGNLAYLLDRLEHAFSLSIILPLGISFHTFQSMSYVVDVYRGQQEPIRNPIDYALFISFFPQLVAGPIVRAREFFADLYHWRKPSTDEALHGTLLILLGLAKKMVMADQFAQIADGYFKNLAGQPGMLTAWSGVIALGIQIHFDFSGYTDMAIGMAKLLGFNFPINFRRPYIASSMTDFWHRWHISLSRWLRDYLYISFGGNGPAASERWTLLYPIQAALTFALANISWVFFRAANFHESLWILRQMFFGGKGTMLIPRWALYLALTTLVLAVLEEKKEWFERVCRWPAWAYGAACAILLLAVELLGFTEAAVPFVYFQF